MTLGMLSETDLCSSFQEDQSHGELVLDFEEGKIFSVAQHQNDPNLNFLCIESKQVELYHQGSHFVVFSEYLHPVVFLS